VSTNFIIGKNSVFHHVISATPLEKPLAKWYALYVRSRFEKKVYQELQKKHIECFLPLIEEIRIWSDRKKKVHVPLFQGYVFVRSDLKNKLPILEIAGVVKFVGIRTQPSAIPDEQINWIKVILQAKDAVRREHYPFLGQKVEVVAGPLRGVRGVVSQIRSRTRIVVAVDSIFQALSIEVQPEFLRLLK